MSIYAKMNKKKKEEEEESSEDEIKENEEEEEEEEEDISNSSVLDKYKTAADIANRALQKVVSEAKPGVKIIDLCILGDKEIEENLKKVYTKKKDMEKGVAFPTCVSVNEVVGHFSPIADDPSGELKEGDVVKIDLGAHVDGFIGMAATTVVVSLSSAPITGRKADLIQAVNTAAECAHRLIKPGKTNSEVTAMIKKIAEIYKVNPMEGVLSHQIKRYIVDGNKVIINKETVDQKVEEFTFEQGEVYCVDILMSTGEGKAREVDSRTTVFKRALDQTYLLKLNAARAVLNEINKKFPTFPFTMRALEDKRARLGVSEMLKHDLLHNYPVLHEKSGEFVAQIKFTVMITSSATERNTISPLQQLQPDIKLEDKPIIDLLAQGTKRGAKKNKKKKPKKKEGEKTEEVKTETKA